MRIHTKKLLSIFPVVVCVVNLYAQDSIQTIYPPNERFGVKEGLSQGLVMSMIQDKEGYMWFGTGDGLNKYDGYNITVYRNSPDDKYSLPENSVTSLLEDKYGNFWVGTMHKGLYLFDKKTERFYPTSLKAEFNRPGCLKMYNDKLLVLTSANIFVYKIKPVNLLNDTTLINQNVQLLFNYDAMQKDTAYKITLKKVIFQTWMPDCSFWLVLNDTVLHYIHDNNFKNWQAKRYSFRELGIQQAALAVDVAMAPIPHLPGRLLIYSNNNLSEFDVQKNKIITSIIFTTDNQHEEKKLISLNDSIFIFNDYNNLFVFDEHTKKISKWDMRQQNANLCFIYGTPLTDAAGISWLCSNGFGALKCDLLKQHFTNFKSYNSYHIFFSKFYDGDIPFPQEMKRFYYIEYNQITQDKQGIYWMYLKGSGKLTKTNNLNETDKSELISFNPVTKIITHWPGLANNFPYNPSVYLDPQNRLWIAGSYSLNQVMIYQIDKKTGKPLAGWQIPTTKLMLDNSFIMQWWQDANQVFWLATVNGLYSFDFIHNKWKHWLHIEGDSSSISIDWLYTLCADPAEPQRYVWLGTNGNGFDKFDMLAGKCIKHYSMADGLPNNVVYGILPDDAGNLWMSTNKGLSCFNPKEKTFQNFTQEDGLPGDEFNHFQFSKLKNGDLNFGGVEGVTVFNPAIVLQKQKPVPVVFTGLSISNKPVDWKQDSSVLPAPISYAKTITLHPGQNMFTISFASLEYRSNRKKFYKYKLDGFDKNYTEPSTKNEATYTNLDPGTYTFYITGTNSGGVWNEKGTSIQIIVLPYWYQTYWFMALVALLVVAMFYLFYRYRLQHVLKMQRLRNRIATDLHDEIGSTLSSISLYGESAKMMMKDNEAAGSVLSKINSSTSEMMEAMSDIVWAVNTRNDKLDNLANRMRSFAVQMADAKSVQLHFTDNKDLPEMPLNMEQRKNIYLIFKEALNNAIKYSCCQNLWISFINEKNILVLTIKDDGKGFVHHQLSKNVPVGYRGGNGVLNMKKRAEEIKGELLINTAEGKGTEIMLKLALKKS